MTEQAVDRDAVVGRSTGTAVVHVERGPVSAFAASVTDHNPIYARADAAREHGFADVPLPPTFAFSALGFWGTWAEEQPPDDPSRGSNPMAELMGTLMAKGGLVLHGEQEFVYHRPVVAGDVLHKEGEVVDLYTKERKGATMTFLVVEDRYTTPSGEPVLTSRMNLIHRL